MFFALFITSIQSNPFPIQIVSECLHNLFRWKLLDAGKLKSVLKEFGKVDGAELVKFLRETFDALCDILTAKPDNETVHLAYAMRFFVLLDWIGLCFHFISSFEFKQVCGADVNAGFDRIVQVSELVSGG